MPRTSARRPPVVLACDADVVALRRRVHLTSRRSGIGPIEVRLTGLTPSASLKTQLRLNALVADGGGSIGSVFVIVAALSSGLLLWLLNGSPFKADWSDLVLLGVMLVVAAIAGKLIGIGRATLRLGRELDALFDHLAGPTPGVVAPLWHTGHAS